MWKKNSPVLAFGFEKKNLQIDEKFPKGGFGCEKYPNSRKRLFFNVFFENLHATGAYIYIKPPKSVASSLIKCCRPKQLEELRRASKFESKHI